MPDAPDVPEEMRAIVASAFGDPELVLSAATVPVPAVAPGSNHLLLRVHACSLSPGDYRMLLGDAPLIKTPADGFPYVPCGDVAGVVVAASAAAGSPAAAFPVGTHVVATWSGAFGAGGLAEYALVDARCAAVRPAALSALQGAALANSAGHALRVVREARIAPGERVLVLGGCGGVGSAVVQLARDAGAAFVAATGTDADMLAALGVDRAVDYRAEDWAAVAEFAADKFDVVVDCAEGRAAWGNARLRAVLRGGREGGRFVAVVLQDWHIEVHSWWQVPALLCPPLWRAAWTAVAPGAPRYRMHLGGPDGAAVGEVLALAAAGRLRPVIARGAPFAFSERGARDAFALMVSRRAHGKVVVAVAPEAA